MNLRLAEGVHGPEMRRLVRRALAGEFCLVPMPARQIDGGWLARIEACDAAFGLFTSGTSGGAPRICFLSRRNVEASVTSILSLFDERRLDGIFCYPQPSHVFGLVLGYVMAELRGLELYAAPGKYGASAHALRASLALPGLLTLGTPAHFFDLIEAAPSLAPSYSAIVGGAPLSRAGWRAIRDRLHIAQPSIGYGATEASPGVTHLPPGEEPREDGEIGYALPGVAVRITDDGIAFRGENVATAIADERGTTSPDEGFLRDRILLRADGRFVYGGRLDAVLNRGGEKFSLDELERRIPVAAMCVALSDARLGQELGVLMRETCDIAVLGVPFSRARVLTVAEFPRAENGKPSRTLGAALFARFPIAARSLSRLVPHRDPMIWIDEVTGQEEAVLHFRSDGAYADARGLRPSSLIELMAQGYAFARAAVLEDATPPARAYLAAMSDISLRPRPIAEGERLTIRTRRIRELGDLTLVAAEVRGADDEILARGQLKLYSLPGSRLGNLAHESQ